MISRCKKCGEIVECYEKELPIKLPKNYTILEYNCENCGDIRKIILKDFTNTLQRKNITVKVYQEQRKEGDSHGGGYYSWKSNRKTTPEI